MPYPSASSSTTRALPVAMHPGVRPIPAASASPWSRPALAFAALDDRRLGQTSGWVSAVFGLAQFCAPRAFARAVGMRYRPGVIQAVGLRDFVLGAAILARPDSAGWRWMRAVSDVMDIALVGAAAFAPADRRRLAAFAALAGAVVAFDLAAAQHRAPLGQALLESEEGGRP